MRDTRAKIEDIVGLTMTSVVVSESKEEIIFKTTENQTYKMFHDRDCCEEVLVDDICGDINDLINTPILSAAESSNSEECPKEPYSFTWTFYHIRTIKGTVTIKWYGESNGYYSEEVSFNRIRGD